MQATVYSELAAKGNLTDALLFLDGYGTVECAFSSSCLYFVSRSLDSRHVEYHEEMRLLENPPITYSQWLVVIVVAILGGAVYVAFGNTKLHQA
jgi:hypothetical protein